MPLGCVATVKPATKLRVDKALSCPDAEHVCYAHLLSSWPQAFDGLGVVPNLSCCSRRVASLLKQATTLLGSAADSKAMAGDDFSQLLAETDKNGNVTTSGWITKLSLQRVLSCKCGVTLRHAKIHLDKISLTKPKEHMQLKNHLQLVEWAQLLSPWGLSRASTADIMAAVEGLARSCNTQVRCSMACG